MTPLAAGILALVLLAQTVALVAIVWRVLNDAPVRREQEHAFALGCIERAKAQDAREVAEADALREAAKAAEVSQIVADTAASAEIENQRKQGWARDIAEGRAAMVGAGMDPDDPRQVLAWNLRHEAAS